MQWWELLSGIEEYEVTIAKLKSTLHPRNPQKSSIIDVFTLEHKIDAGTGAQTCRVKICEQATKWRTGVWFCCPPPDHILRSRNSSCRITVADSRFRSPSVTPSSVLSTSKTRSKNNDIASAIDAKHPQQLIYWSSYITWLGSRVRVEMHEPKTERKGNAGCDVTASVEGPRGARQEHTKCNAEKNFHGASAATK